MRLTLLNSRIVKIFTTISLKLSQNKGKIVQYGTQNKGKMTNREILLEMYEKLWNADKDKFTWYAIVKDSLDKLETFNTKEKWEKDGT